jgi:hypothetical protein
MRGSERDTATGNTAIYLFIGFVILVWVQVQERRDLFVFCWRLDS